MDRTAGSDEVRTRIDIVSDVVCPWCIIGFKQLERALIEAGSPAVDIRWHPFELNPQMPREGQDLREHLAEKYGTTLERNQAAHAQLTQLGAELGVRFAFDDQLRIVNTFQAHQLLHWAGEGEGEGEGGQAAAARQTTLELALFEAYFSRSQRVDDPTVLVEAAGRAGLDEQQAAAVLDDGRYAGVVRQREQRWLARGIHAVPAFIFDGRYLVSGAQGPATLAEVLLRCRREAA